LEYTRHDVGAQFIAPNSQADRFSVSANTVWKRIEYIKKKNNSLTVGFMVIKETTNASA
jgi:hypothetical protein